MSDDRNQSEFMTAWHTGIKAWSNRKKSSLMGTARSTDYVPAFRPFDLLALPNSSAVLLENADHRIGVESVCGAQPFFRRHIDFDTIYFQFAGTTTLETEYGEYVMSPGDLLLVPGGTAHRATGTADSLRWFAYLSDPVTDVMDETTAHTGESTFRMLRHGGPDWTVPPGMETQKKSGIVEERMICWHHGPDDRTIVERDYESLAGVSSTEHGEQRSAIRKIRAFDIFTGVAGKRGGVDPIFRAAHLEVKTYNITGEQFAFHRALRTEEVHVQFRGDATDMSELESGTFHPGDASVIPRGIAHSVITVPPDSPEFLRLNFYSNLPWSYPTDLTRHRYHSSFEVQTIVHKEAAWRIAAGLVVPSPVAR